MRSTLLLLLTFRAMLPTAPAGEPPQNIFGGDRAAPCAWPTVVGLAIQNGDSSGFCSGTLVAPDIVIYAAHCSANIASIGFGEDVRALFYGANVPGGGAGTPQRTVRPAYCRVHPLYDGNPFETGHDFAYCKLSEPMTDIPIIPIAMGCETQVLKPGKAAFELGLSTSSENGVLGYKNAAETHLDSLDGNVLHSVGKGKGTCSGDSGGPLMAQLNTSDGLPTAAGDWRLVGTLTGSFGPNDVCDPSANVTDVHQAAWLAVSWIEQDANVDISPCHEADGTWHPGPQCRAFPLQPATGAGTWASGCGPGAVTPWSSTCGAPYDFLPASVSIASPVADADVAVGSDVEVSVEDPQHWLDDANRVREDTLALSVDGSPLVSQPVRHTPFVFESVQLPAGTHTLVATFTDTAGQAVTSAPVTVTVDGSRAKGLAGGNGMNLRAAGGCHGGGDAAPLLLLAAMATVGLRVARRRY
jgi:hypothetical protein